MRFDLFMYCTMGRRHELEAGLAGLDNDLYQRMLDEIRDIAQYIDQNGWHGLGHPEHHLQVEGFEAANDLGMMAMWIAQHTEALRVISCGYVAPTHNPLRVAEQIATLDHMTGGRLGVGVVRGYQHRWVEQFKIRPDLAAVGKWNKDTDVDLHNRRYFEEFVEVVVTALTNPTFSYEGDFWKFPADDKNPHVHTVYSDYGAGVDADMTIREVGIAPRPLQTPHPPLYGGFTMSMASAVFWAKYGGTPIVLSDKLDFCEALWKAYREEADRHEVEVPRGHEAAWGGTAVCAETDAEAEALFEDMAWFWDTWAQQFGQGMPLKLVGSPDTITRQIEEAHDKLGFDEVFFLVPQGIHSGEQIISSLDLITNKVMSRFS
ncbi:MAG: LLM class flavin-dependent oxidoreductase [Actinomycetota bacterium]|jgi:alkanesulfonate monooxygenase SsuD/methylene tetrahydromethanopterin reductase-like flavin-dependent oxidoreductase (luciferase family)|nr:LLM class flavin-dependent oxidoreductase [Actinomycetota bacterium]